MIHANVAMIAFVALPVAAALVSNGLGVASGSNVLKRALRALGIATAVTLAIFFVSLAPVFSNRAPVLLGLTERVLLVVYAAWLTAAALAQREWAEAHAGTHLKRAARGADGS